MAVVMALPTAMTAAATMTMMTTASCLWQSSTVRVPPYYLCSALLYAV
jgi:hypothetical protein